MNTIIITENKFKKDKEKIDNILTTYSFKKITKTTYIGKLNKEEEKILKETLKENSNKQDTLILIPICKRCKKNTTQYGKEIKLEEEQYVIL